MKILQIVQGIPPHSNGGTQIYAYNLAKALSEKEEVSILYTSKHYAPSNINEAKYTLSYSNKDKIRLIKLSIEEPLTHIINPKYSIHDPDIERIFENLLIQTLPDIIHIHHLSNFSHGIILVAKKFKIPVIFTLHDVWFICHKVTRIDFRNEICIRNPGKICTKCYNEFLVDYIVQKNLTCKFFGKPGFRLFFSVFSKLFKWDEFFEKRMNIIIKALLESDIIIAPTNFIKEEYIKYGIPENKILVSPHGIDTKPFEKTKNKKNKVKENGITFGYVGQVGFNKGVHLLIDAINNLEKYKVSLKIFGDSNESAYSCRLYEEAENPNIEFKGKFTPEEISEIYEEFDVMVVPSIGYENSPLSISEGLCNKIPIIASDTGGIPELVNNSINGLIFEKGNVNDLREKILLLIENINLFESLQNGIVPIRDIHDQANELLEIYSKLLIKTDK